MKQFKQKSGFTLIELLVAVALFVVVATMSMGSILGVFDASRQSRAMKSVMNSVNLTLEAMSKEMRYGVNYHCGSSGAITSPQNCPAGDNFLSFLSSEDLQTTYRLTGTRIEREIDGGGYIGMSAPEVIIDDLTFYTLGAGIENVLQPKVIVTIKGHAGSGDNQSNFTLQTLVSQRAIDIGEIPEYPTPYVSPPPPVFYDLTVTKNPSGGGTVSGPSINCGITCAASYADDSDVTLTQVPAVGSIFTGWSGSCGGNLDCNLTMNSDKAVTANYSVTSYPIDYLIIGGGGAGGLSVSDAPAGAGGAGGMRSSEASGQGTVYIGNSYFVTVGAGGVGVYNYGNSNGGNGGNSSIIGGPGGSFSITSTGGGGGGGTSIAGPLLVAKNGNSGGSGGGGGNGGLGGARTVGQGNIGGNNTGGGGGAGAAGQNSGNGGIGLQNSITGAAVYYAGGGGTGLGAGGLGGGGSGGDGGALGTPGTPNTGGGGGAAMNGGDRLGASGGSGKVIIRYAGAQRGTGGVVSCIGGGTPPNCVSYTLHTFNVVGTSTFTP